MIKGWNGFLESVNDEFSELEGLIEKEVAYLNLINDIIIRYQDQYEFSYEFNSDLIFYDGQRSRLIQDATDERWTMRKIIKVNDEIYLDKNSNFLLQKPSRILKAILNSPAGYIKYEIFIDGGLKSGDISNMIIDEIRSQYPFTRIDLPIRTPNHIYLYLEVDTKNFRS